MFYLNFRNLMPPPLIISVGEALVDFVSITPGLLSTSPGFFKRLGGEGANVASGLAKFGARVIFLGRIANDPFGRFLLRDMKQRGVDVRYVVRDRRFRTRLAFVSRKPSGERDFDFWEDVPAASRLVWTDIPTTLLRRARLITIAPLLLVAEPARTTALRLAALAQKRGVAVAFDTNVRLSLWRSHDEARQTTLAMIRLSTILRMNDEEAHFLTGRKNALQAARSLQALGPRVVAINHGPDGCTLHSRTATVVSPGYRVSAVDTTGCGDAFFAALLYGIATAGVELGRIKPQTWRAICHVANAAGALTAVKPGGADALPSLDEIEHFLGSQQEQPN